MQSKSPTILTVRAWWGILNQFWVWSETASGLAASCMCTQNSLAANMRRSNAFVFCGDGNDNMWTFNTWGNRCVFSYQGIIYCTWFQWWKLSCKSKGSECALHTQSLTWSQCSPSIVCHTFYFDVSLGQVMFWLCLSAAKYGVYLNTSDKLVEEGWEGLQFLYARFKEGVWWDE